MMTLPQGIVYALYGNGTAVLSAADTYHAHDIEDEQQDNEAKG